MVLWLAVAQLYEPEQILGQRVRIKGAYVKIPPKGAKELTDCFRENGIEILPQTC